MKNIKLRYDISGEFKMALDYELITKLLIQIHKVFEEAIPSASENSPSPPSKKEVVIVLGDTGSGKSTLINAALGIPLEEKFNKRLGKKYIDIVGVNEYESSSKKEFDEDDSSSDIESDEDDSSSEIEPHEALKEGIEEKHIVIEGVGSSKDESVKKLSTSEYAKIGHGSSETTIPQVFTLTNGDLIFDMPGFNDTRSSVEFDIALYLAIQMLLESGVTIKHIIVLMEENGLTTSRGQNLWGLVNTLCQMIDADALEAFAKENMTFGVTKCSGKFTTDQIKKQLEDFHQNKLEDLSRAHVIPEAERKILNFMGSMMHGNVMKMEVLDGNFKDKILERLNDSPMKGKECLSMLKNKVYHHELLNCTSEIAKEYIELWELKEKCAREAQELEEKIVQLEKQKQDLQCLQNSEQGFDGKFKSRVLEFYEKKIINLESELPNLDRKLSRYRIDKANAYKEYELQLREQWDKEEMFTSKYCEGEKYNWDVAPGVVNTHNMKYNGPYCDIDEDCVRSVTRRQKLAINRGSYGYIEWKKTDKNPDPDSGTSAGIECIYYTPSHFYGDVEKFVVYAYKNQLSSYSLDLEYLNKLYKNASDRVSDTEHEVTKKKKDLESTKKSLTAEIGDIKREIGNKILEIDKELSEFKNSLININAELKETEKLLSKKENIEKFKFLDMLPISFKKGMIENTFRERYAENRYNLECEKALKGNIESSIIFRSMPAVTSTMTSKRTTSLVPEEKEIPPPIDSSTAPRPF